MAGTVFYQNRVHSNHQPEVAPLILASASPRRHQLLKKIITQFDIIPGNINENQLMNEDPVTYVLRISKGKGRSAFAIYGSEKREKRGCWILAADTVVVLDHTILGKPNSSRDALRMLEGLQGRRHKVITGICLMHPEKDIFILEAVHTHVWMRNIEKAEMEAYVRKGEPMDKAGGYAIQGLAGKFIRKIEGSLTNVIGLPMERLQAIFRSYGIT